MLIVGVVRMAFFAGKLPEGTLTLVDLGSEFTEDGVVSWLVVLLVGVELILSLIELGMLLLLLLAREGM